MSEQPPSPSAVPLTRRSVVQGAAAAALATGLRPASARGAATRPHILFILADDLGYADLSCYGRRDYRTPVLDRLAAQGLRLTQGYSSSPVCSATRVGLITGRYPHRLRVGLEEPIAGPDPALGLPPGQPTLPGLLQRAGYRTSLVGKWHLGSPPAHGPLQHGYERFFGIVGGAVDYFTHQAGNAPGRRVDGLYEGNQTVQRPGYLTDLLADRAIAELREGAKGRQPLFLSLHFTAPHWPWEGPGDKDVPATLGSLHHYDGGSLKTYAEMVTRLDAAIGRVLRALEQQGLARDTLVIFTSDNGGERFSDTWPFTGGKSELLEGGIRVPLLLRWPARLRAGGHCEQVMSSMDFLPTLLAAAGSAPDPQLPPDGEDLLPVLTGARPVHPRTLYWRFKASAQAALRDGDWKYLRIAGRARLFDVAADPRERADLSERHPELLRRLEAGFATWDKSMLPYPAESYSGSPKGALPDRY